MKSRGQGGGRPLSCCRKAPSTQKRGSRLITIPRDGQPGSKGAMRVSGGTRESGGPHEAPVSTGSAPSPEGPSEGPPPGQSPRLPLTVMGSTPRPLSWAFLLRSNSVVDIILQRSHRTDEVTR